LFAEFGESTPDADWGEVGGEETGDVGVEAEVWRGEMGVEAAAGVVGAEDVWVGVDGATDVGVDGAETGGVGAGDPGDAGTVDRVNEETDFEGKVLL
jgi:hypothetical protein